MRLTDRAIKTLKPSTKDQFLSDGGGLYLRVKPSGSKTFLIRSQVNGKTRWTSIGDYPTLTLMAARRRLESFCSDEATVERVYREFDRAVLARYKRPDVSRARFANDVLPTIGHLPIAEVTRKIVFDKVLSPILLRNARVMANRTMADVKHLFQFAFERGYITEDPTIPITRKSCGGKEKPRDRVLSFDEVEGFLHALLDDFHGKRGMHVTTMAALYICLLTGQRASEVLWIMHHWTPGATSSLLPPAVCKSPRAHLVHLSLQARAALRLCRPFPLPRDHRVLSHALRRIEATFTPHDLRRTLSTRLSDLGAEPYVIEKILNHRMTGVMAVYNHAEYMPQREAALKLWGRKVAELRRKRQRPEPL